MPIGETGIYLRKGRRRHADFRIEGAEALRAVVALGEFLEGVAQERGVALVENAQHGYRFGSVSETLPGKSLRTGNRFDGFWVDSLFHDPI